MTQEPGSGTPMSERMQSLLSRAVEDQLSEQRQLAGALGEVRTHLARLGEQLTELRTTPLRDEPASDSQLSALSADIREAVRLMSERIDGVGRLVAQRGEDLSGLRATLAELDERVRSQGTALTALSGGLQSMPSYGDRVAALAQNLEGLHQRLGSLDELERAVTQLGPMLGEVGVASTEQAGTLAELQARFDRFEQVLASRPPAQGGAAGAPAALPEDLNQRLSVLQEDMTALGSDVAGLVESAVDRASLRAAVDAVEAAAARMGRLDDVVNQVADLRLGVMGPGGIVATLEQLAGRLSEPSGEVGLQVDAAVRRAVAESEARLAGHVDDAVLALAEVLLRRQPARSARPPVVDDVPEPVDPPQPTLPMAAPAASTLAEEPAAESAPDQEPEAEPAQEPAQTQAWAPQTPQTPQPPAPPAERAPGGEQPRHAAEDSSKRRWFRS